jgi:hypothetical protein
MALATVNLSVNSIKQALGVSSAKLIFYNANGTLKTIAELGALVNKNGLSAYCPGATADEKLANLRTYRRFSYFKGYAPIAGYLTASPNSIEFSDMIGDSSIITINSNVNWNVTGAPTWLSIEGGSGSNNGTIKVTTTAENGTGHDRGGVITITGGGYVRTVSVTQFYLRV